MNVNTFINMVVFFGSYDKAYALLSGLEQLDVILWLEN